MCQRCYCRDCATAYTHHRLKPDVCRACEKGCCPMNIFIVGAKSHARICRRILLAKYPDIAKFPLVYDMDDTTLKPWPSHLFHNWSATRDVAGAHNCTHFVVAIGSNGRRRAEISEELVEWGLKPLNVIHPTAFIS